MWINFSLSIWAFQALNLINIKFIHDSSAENVHQWNECQTYTNNIHLIILSYCFFFLSRGSMKTPFTLMVNRWTFRFCVNFLSVHTFTINSILPVVRSRMALLLFLLKKCFCFRFKLLKTPSFLILFYHPWWMHLS